MLKMSYRKWGYPTYLDKKHETSFFNTINELIKGFFGDQ